MLVGKVIHQFVVVEAGSRRMVDGDFFYLLSLSCGADTCSATLQL